MLAENCGDIVYRRVRPADGLALGRPQTTKDDILAIFYKHYPAFASGHMNVSELARICGLSRPTVYKYLRIVG